METPRDRIYKYLGYKRLSARAFQLSLDLSVSYVHNMTGKVSQPILERIAHTYPDLNLLWVQEGVGNMLNDDVEEEVNTVPLLPLCAQAGKLSDFENSAVEYECERLVSPMKDAELAITISGESMSPEYPNGSKVLIKKVNESAFIDWGHSYVLDTCNGIILKNIYPGTSSETIKCVSVNPAFPPFEVLKSDVRGWYRVLLCLSLK